jgi:hypothetical protein
MVFLILKDPCSKSETVKPVFLEIGQQLFLLKFNSLKSLKNNISKKIFTAVENSIPHVLAIISI